MNKDKSAYPNPIFGEDGLTKREMFAMAAMQGILARRGFSSYVDHDTYKYIAEDAIIIADELLKQLEK